MAAGDAKDAAASATAEKENAPPRNESLQTAQVAAERDVLVGTRVRKNFGSRFFWGSIAGRYTVTGGVFYKVSFDDGDVDVFAASEVMEDVKQARRHAKEDKLQPVGTDSSPLTEYQEEMRRPTLKRKREEAGGEIRVRVWGQRLYASIYTTDDRQTFIKDFLKTEDGQLGELESTGLVRLADRIVSVNGAQIDGMASWEVSEVIRQARRPLLLLLARGDGTIPIHGRSADGNESSSASSGIPTLSRPEQMGPVAAPATGRSFDASRPVTCSSNMSGTQAPTIPALAQVAVNSEQRSDAPIRHPSNAQPSSSPTPQVQETPGELQVILTGVPRARSVAVTNTSKSYNGQVTAPGQHSARDAPSSDSRFVYLAAVAAANDQMKQLREALLLRQREQQGHQTRTREELERQGRMQEQLRRMGPNMPTSGLAASVSQPSPSPSPSASPTHAPHPTSSGLWYAHPHASSNSPAPAPVPPGLDAPQIVRNQPQPMLAAPYHLPLRHPVANPAMFRSWVPALQQGGHPGQREPYSVVPNAALPPSVYPSQHQVPRSRFEVVDGTAETQSSSVHGTSPSPPQEPSPVAPPTHTSSKPNANSASESTLRMPPPSTVATLSSTELHEAELDMDDDAAAIAAMEGTSPSKEGSASAPAPTSFLSPASSSVDAGANADSSASTDTSPMIEGDNYSVVTIHKRRLLMTLGSIGSQVAVTSFVCDENGEQGEVEQSGKVLVGDVVVGVNGVRLRPNMSASMLAHLVSTTPRPMTMWFERASWETLIGST